MCWSTRSDIKSTCCSSRNTYAEFSFFFPFYPQRDTHIKRQNIRLRKSQVIMIASAELWHGSCDALFWRRILTALQLTAKVGNDGNDYSTLTVGYRYALHSLQTSSFTPFECHL